MPPVDTVLINSGPWLPVPPDGYGGIENVVATLVPELRARGVRVVLSAAAGSTIEVDRLITPLEAPRFGDLAAPYAQTCGTAHAHMAAVLAALGDDERIDVVHDHLEVVGPSMLAALGPSGPPVLQTLHWDMRKHPEFYASFDGGGRIWFNGVSHRQVERAPSGLRRQVVGVVPLSVDVTQVPFSADKGERCLSLARISPLKGTDVAARICRAAGVPLDVAGPVGTARHPGELTDDADHPDAAYYRRQVQPLEDDAIRWIGSVSGPEKLAMLGAARALVFPVQWEEPGATAVVEALACGTPVIGTRRGVLPTLVDHGRTGFLADDEDELAAYVSRAHEIDPFECRRVAEEQFSSGVMAERYLALYEEVSRRAAASRGRPATRAGGEPRWLREAPGLR